MGYRSGPCSGKAVRVVGRALIQIPAQVKVATQVVREMVGATRWTESRTGKLSPTERDLRHTLGRPLTVV